MQGRLTEPVYKPAGEDHYEPVSWDEAFGIVGRQAQRAWTRPDQAAFYTSGRTANEAAFLYQLFVRAFGTNNLPDCSNMCHESTGGRWARPSASARRRSPTTTSPRRDLIIIMGQNPGTNHPRMLTALEEAKRSGRGDRGRQPAAGGRAACGTRTRRRSRASSATAPTLADQFLQIRLGGDMALLQAVSKRVLDAEAQEPGHRAGPRVPGGALRTAWTSSRRTSPGSTSRAVLAGDRAAQSRRSTSWPTATSRPDRVIITWAMGITQHKKGVATIKEIINLLLLRGNIGKPGAGASPIRGHSNVQGDRTMGIWEQMPPAFLDALGKEFGFDPPREHGADAVRDHPAMRDGEIKVFVAMGGNFVGGDLGHRRCRGGDGEHRADRPGLHQAQPLARR